MRTASYLDSRRRERCTECGSGLDLCQCIDPDAMAHERLTSLAGKYLTEVLTEEENIPSDQAHIFEKIVNVIGDVGDNLVSHAEQRSPSPDVIRRKLVQLGALITRLASVGTDEYPYPQT